MKYERGALVRGSDPPSGHSVHKRPVIRGGRLPGVPYKHLGAAVYKTGDKNLGPSPMAKKKDFVSGLGEEHRTLRATSCSLDHGST